MRIVGVAPSVHVVGELDMPGCLVAAQQDSFEIYWENGQKSAALLSGPDDGSDAIIRL